MIHNSFNTVCHYKIIFIFRTEDEIEVENLKNIDIPPEVTETFNKDETS